MSNLSTRQTLDQIKRREQKILKTAQSLKPINGVNQSNNINRNAKSKRIAAKSHNNDNNNNNNESTKVIPKQEIQRLTISQAIVSYIRVCKELRDDAVDSFFDLAWKKYLWYEDRFAAKYGPEAVFGDRFLYRRLLALAAEKGDFEHLELIWRRMRKEGVEPEMEDFAQAFKLAGRKGHVDDEFFAQIKYQFESGVFQPEELLINSVKEKGEDCRRIFRGLKISFPELNLNEDVTKSKPLKPYLSPLVDNLNRRDCSRLKSPFAGQSESEFEVQYANELRGIVKVASIKKKELDPRLKSLTDELVQEWRLKLYSALNERINNQLRIKAKLNNTPMTTYPFFKALSIGDFVDILLDDILRMLKMSESYSPSVSNLQRNLGMAVLDKFHIRMLSEGDYSGMFKDVYGKYFQWFGDPKEHWCHREAMVQLAADHESKITLGKSDLDWPYPLRLAIGRELLNVIMHHLSVSLDKEGRLIIGEHSVKVTEGQLDVKPKSDGATTSTPAFFKLFRSRINTKHQLEEMKALPILVKIFSMNKFDSLEFDATEMPMTVPPVPWTSPDHGGFLLRNSVFVRQPIQGRIKTFVNDRDEVEIRNQKIYPVFDSLNQLGSMPWKVNKKVLDLAVEVFVNQERYAQYLNKLGLPLAEDQLHPPKLDPKIKAKLEKGEDFSRVRSIN